MFKIIRQKSFIKDLAKIKMSDTQYTKFIKYLSHIINNEELPKEAKNHSLSGEWTDTLELHIGGDLLLIYMLIDDCIVLIRIGSHAQLFK